jgi:hypothetical protein
MSKIAIGIKSHINTQYSFPKRGNFGSQKLLMVFLIKGIKKEKEV